VAWCIANDEAEIVDQTNEKLLVSASAPKGVIEKTMRTARLKASPDTNLYFSANW
jgi:hypothetical protein